MNLFTSNRKKIPCYVLIYKEIEIIKKSLLFFASLSEYIDIIVIENPSENTPAISDFVNELGIDRKVSKYYLFDENISNNAYDIIIGKDISSIERSELVIVSDGDITVEKPMLWLKESKSILRKNKDIFSRGAALDMFNLPIETFPNADEWVPPLISETKIHEGLTGCHLLMFHGNELSSFMKWKQENNGFFVDSELHKYCYSVIKKRWARTVKSLAYHLTWDLYMNLDNEYTKMKLSKSHKDIWYHRKKSGYRLIEY